MGRPIPVSRTFAGRGIHSEITMNKPSDQTRTPGPINNAPTFIALEIPDPKASARDVIRHITPKDAIREPFTQISEKDARKAPLLAAMDNDDELLKPEGQAQKLTGLVQGRYAITRDDADKQIEQFVEKHDS
jgi:hypothetical protein